MKPYIYKVTDKVTGEFYIGSQCRGKVIGKNYFTSSKNKIFKNKFKSNPAQFEIKIIGTFTDPESCVLQENIFIKFYIKNPLCLNKNYVIGKEHQFCMSGCTGEKNPFYGKQHSKETKYKISEANKGRLSARKGCHLSDETRKKLSELKKGNTPWNKGKHFSADIRKKISESNKGHISFNKGKHLSDEIKMKLSISHIGVSPSDETRKKLSESHKGKNNFFYGKHHTEETKQKLSELHKGNTPWNKGKSQYFNRRKIICIETQIVYSSAKEAGISNNIAPSNITMCAQHKYKQAGGFHWEYADSHIPTP